MCLLLVCQKIHDARVFIRLSEKYILIISGKTKAHVPNPTIRRAVFSVTANSIYDRGIPTSGNNKVIDNALLGMTLLL